MSVTKKDLLYFFDRPLEPCFMQKGNAKVFFQIPENYFPDIYKTAACKLRDPFGKVASKINSRLQLGSYKSVVDMLINRFRKGASKIIPIRNVNLPDLELPMRLPYNHQFSLFLPKHQEMAGKLIDIFMEMRDLEDLQSVCAYCQLRINPYMFNYCLSVALLHRPDTKGLSFPSFAETFPDKFMDPRMLAKAREVSNIVIEGPRKPIILPMNYTASDKLPEQRMAYFREDIGVNLHHWHWHLVYPTSATDITIVNKDRRGELFYYMHQQIIARYNVGRMCNNLSRVERFNEFRAPMKEGYFSKLNHQVASRALPPRFAETTLKDLERTDNQITVDVSEMELWRDHFLAAVQNKSVRLPDGSEKPLDEETGMDILGNLMEASMLSLNKTYYGNFHNMGHNFIAYSHDPDHRHLERDGVMGDTATAMRDPIFYRWHAYINDLFQIYKNNLTPYSSEKLDFPGVRVLSINIEGKGRANTISTLWEQSTVELDGGLDFAPRGSVLVSFTHLQHDEFKYVIEVNNTSGQGLMGTVRIFMAPQQDEKGQPLSFHEQRTLMIELDKFSQRLHPGMNTIRRRSLDSSVTIPYERTFPKHRAGDPGSAEVDEFNFCGCGWPQHMLVPKGTTKGYPVVLFVMVSNWANDGIEQDLVGSCNDAASYCGIRDRKYPDRQAMGYPFDRPTPKASTISDFLRPNMAVRECSIQFTDTTRQRAQQG